MIIIKLRTQKNLFCEDFKNLKYKLQSIDCRAKLKRECQYHYFRFLGSILVMEDSWMGIREAFGKSDMN